MGTVPTDFSGRELSRFSGGTATPSSPGRESTSRFVRNSRRVKSGGRRFRCTIGSEPGRFVTSRTTSVRRTSKRSAGGSTGRPMWYAGRSRNRGRYAMSWTTGIRWGMVGDRDHGRRSVLWRRRTHAITDFESAFTIGHYRVRCDSRI